MIPEFKTVQQMLKERPRRRVYRRPTLTGSQRAAYYGIPMITPSTSRETTTGDKEKDVAEKEKSNLQESTLAAASAHTNESSLPSYTISKSALDVFNRTKKSVSTTEEEDENVQAASDPANPNESAISSFNISQSALDVFNLTKKSTTTTEDDEEEKKEENTTEESSLGNNDDVEAVASVEALTDLTSEPMEVDEPPATPESAMKIDEPPATPKRTPHSLKEESMKAVFETPKSSKSPFDVSSFSRLLCEFSTAAVTSNSQPPNSIPNNVAPTVSQPPISSAAQKSNVAPVVSSSQPLKSRAALLLPRFMQPTTSSTAHASTQPISCASPICSKPSTAAPLQLRKQQQPSKPQRPHFTPRKSVAVVRKIADQSFNAPKLPELDMTLYEGIPRAPANPPINNALSSLRKSAGKRALPVTPQRPKGSTTFAASKNKEKFNLTSAFSLLQQCESPVTPRVAPKRFTPIAPIEVEPNIASIGNLLEEIVLQTPSPSKEEDILQTSNSSNRSNLVEKENEACRRSFGINDINNPSTVDTEFLKSPIPADNRAIYDNDAANFSAISGFVTDDDDEEEDEQQQQLEENIQQPSPGKENSIVSISSSGPSPERPVVPPKKPAKKKNVTTAPKKAAVEKNIVAATAASTTAAPKKSVKLAPPTTKRNNQKKDLFVLKKPEIIKPISPPSNEPEVRRSKRNRVRVLRRDLGEEPIYEYDEFRMATLVGVKVVRNDSYTDSVDGNEWKTVKKGRKTRGAGGGRKATTRK